MDVENDILVKYLISLEQKGMAKLQKGKKESDTLAMVTYDGLSAANPQEYYKYIPECVDEKDLF